jgi:hypothetical protein
MVTEWGATGHWEVGTTEWGAPIENNSTVKANYYLERYKTAIEPYKRSVPGILCFFVGSKAGTHPHMVWDLHGKRK